MKLFCKIGDCLVIKQDIQTSPWPEETPLKICKGDKYKVVNLIESGWDLERITGLGPLFIRILNKDMSEYVELANDSE
jgi:hypothetical protein